MFLCWASYFRVVANIAFLEKAWIILLFIVLLLVHSSWFLLAMRGKDRFEFFFLTWLDYRETNLSLVLCSGLVFLCSIFFLISVYPLNAAWTTKQACNMVFWKSVLVLRKVAFVLPETVKYGRDLSLSLLPIFKSFGYSISLTWKYLRSQGIGVGLVWLKLWGVSLSFLQVNHLNTNVEIKNISIG